MTTKTAALITSRDKKGIAIIGLLEAALNKAKLDEDQAQRVFEHGGEVQDDVLAILAKYGTPNEFANEEVASDYGYFSGYTKPKPIAEQVKILRQHFPQLGDADESIASQERPAGSEGWFAIPRPLAIAATEEEAFELLIETLKKVYKGKFQNYRKGRLGPQHLRLTKRTKLFLDQIGEAQAGRDVLVMAAQFGLRHRGRSIRRAQAVFNSTEFGLGHFQTGIMLLTHSERLQHYDDLWIDVAGVEYSPDAAGRFGSALSWCFLDGRLGLGYDWVGVASDDFGSASGFSPQ